MPDKRSHRGPHPDDAVFFTPRTQTVLAQAVSDMSWLLSHGYADQSSLKLVGDRYKLTQRQRLAVMRCSCSQTQTKQRTARQLTPEKIANRKLILDGYNILITVEAALSGGVLFMALDGCIRDLASIHGTYRKVIETLPAIKLIAIVLERLSVDHAVWYLDKPVSNSGRLKKLIDGYAQKHSLKWTVELLTNPDKLLIESNDVIASSDSAVLDRCQTWFNLADYIVGMLSQSRMINLLNLRLDRNP